MKIAITSAGTGLDSEVDPRFGRCQYILFVDLDTMEVESVENTGGIGGGGAGVATGNMVAAKGVQTVITGNCGPNAHQVLSAAGIEVITGTSGKVRDVVDKYKSGQYKASTQPNVVSHNGLNK